MFYITSLSEFCASNKIDDAKRDEGLTTPDGVLRFDDIPYGEHPRNVLAFGTPCRVVREIGEHDREFYSNQLSAQRIDWENLEAICDAKRNHPKFL